MARPMTTPPTPADLRLQEICKAFGMGGISDLAKVIGVDVARVSKWGRRNSIAKEGAALIAATFSIPLEWVFNGCGPSGLPITPPDLEEIRHRRDRIAHGLIAPEESAEANRRTVLLNILIEQAKHLSEEDLAIID